jgi:hypothetical protein
VTKSADNSARKRNELEEIIIRAERWGLRLEREPVERVGDLFAIFARLVVLFGFAAH